MKGLKLNQSVFLVAIALLFSCQKEEPKTIPVLETAFPTAVTSTSAVIGGNITSDGGAAVTSRGICWSLEQFPDIEDTKTTDGTGTGSFTSSLSGLTAGTTYYIRAYAVNAVGVGYGNQTTFTTLTVLPTITTTTVASITATTAVSGGQITSDGGAPITARGVCWSTGTNPTIINNTTNNGTGTGTYTSNLTALIPGSTYYVRAYATNSVGTVYGNQVSFTTPAAAATLTTAEVTNITTTTATSGGEITNDGGGTITARGVCWSTSHNPTINDPKTSDVQLQILAPNPFEPSKANAPGGSFISSITGLAPGTIYYVRAYAVNSAGTSYGSEVTFTTLATLPTVSTTIPTSITSTSAQTGGNITSNGGAEVTSRGVCWSTAQNPTIAGNKTADGTGTGSFTSALSGLAAGVTYYIRAYATNTAGTAYGEQLSFTTIATAPTVTTDNVTDLTSTTATAGGEVTANGGATVTEKGVCWSLSQNPTINDTKVAMGTGNGSFSGQISGLMAGRTYYLRAYATNSAGTSYGNQAIFTTLPELPTVITTIISSIGKTSASTGGTITADGGGTITARGVCWSTSQNPTVSNSKTTDGTGTGTFTSNITNLLPGTTYYVRAYATNSAGTSYGAQGSFTTLADSPVITTASISDIATTTASSGGVVVSDGGRSVTARGICWSTGQNPTVSNSKTTDGTGTGSFTSAMTDLTRGTLYYVRAYAINSEGTSYGQQISFTTLVDLPVVTTGAVSGITATTAAGGGEVTDNGGGTITARGVCWSTTENPTTTDSKTTDGTGTGVFTSEISELLPSTTYYLRAYATNARGTVYGTQVTFTTSASIP